jgi:hypothetical protein
VNSFFVNNWIIHCLKSADFRLCFIFDICTKYALISLKRSDAISKYHDGRDKTQHRKRSYGPNSSSSSSRGAECIAASIEQRMRQRVLIVNPTAGLKCYFPMPFHKSAKITVENQHAADINVSSINLTTHSSTTWCKKINT